MNPDNLSSRIGVETAGVLLPHRVLIFLFVANRNASGNLPTSLHLQDMEEIGGSDNQRQISHGAAYSTSGRYGKFYILSPKSCANLETGLSNNTPVESALVCTSHNSKRLQLTDRENMATKKIACRKCFKKTQFTISRIAQLQVFTADYFLYPNLVKNGAL